MQKRFIKYINDKKLFTKDDNILIALSGGIDSVVMLDLLVKSGYNCGIAHCNFKLRGEESNADEEFIKTLALRYDISLFITSFDTKEYAMQNSISIQMAARELRYDWFEEIRNNNGFNYIALAHQMDDVIETFFINLTRGTGIKGLTGIKAKNNKLVRPVLFAKRTEIEKYSDEHNLIYREDSSNAETKYLRNKIRHNVLPVFNEINNHFSLTMLENINRLNEISDVLDSIVENTFESITSFENDSYLIDIKNLKQINHLPLFLYSYLKRFNFSRLETTEIINSLDGISGKQFFSSTHRVIKDREKLIITVINENEQQNVFYINSADREIKNPISLSMKLVDDVSNLEIKSDPAIAYIDYDKLIFPLVLRKWKHGEYFIPFGMDGFKKLSDFFIDIKMSIPEKENIWILALGDDIVWIVGKRIDNRFRIGKKTKRALVLSLH